MKNYENEDVDPHKVIIHLATKWSLFNISNSVLRVEEYVAAGRIALQTSAVQ